ncbi:MJ0548 connectase family domain-containing protein [Methanobrevibacter filiformis]|uniref:DUF2121 domain-containing protein n=1 Tax=Methanobrevibacter filiformis TaxID=55758 RepID=A0A166BLI8_9EURY|nr:DUF2121 domain-containing protein [Methanobrevibacter filiformis]KZX13528.1 hypothetical protein MBFIL_10500 [Methanobrevibacter filiformis]
MSLIIAYVGKKGCVIASDKRKIAYFGDKENIDKLEKELYNGNIKGDDDLYDTASKLDVSLKISEDGIKLRSFDKINVGEVSSKSTTETNRKRIYGTTNGYQIVELSGSKIVHTEKGNNALIIFGNKRTKTLANDLISKKWKSNFSLKYMGDIFLRILEEISAKTPSIGKAYDLNIINHKFTKEEANEYLDYFIEKDIQVLGKFRNQLKSELLEQSEAIQMATKIINQGFVGKIANIENNMLEVQLNKNVQGFDHNWKLLVKPGEKAFMFAPENIDVKIGDKIVIQNETLCVEQNNVQLSCNIILCHL